MTRTRVAELLAECLLYQQPNGQFAPDRRDVHRLLDHARAALEASLIAQQAYAGIRRAHVNVSELGDIAIVDDESGSPRIDIAAWQEAQLDASRNLISSEPPDLGDIAAATNSDDQPPSEERSSFRSLRAALEKQRHGKDEKQAQDAADMLEVDDALLTEFGFGFDSILAVLATVSCWHVPREPRAPIGRITRGELVADIVTWSGLDEAQVERGVDACTLNAEALHDERLPYWQIEQRSARLALRPLIRPPEPAEDDELWLLPRRAHATQRTWARYLNDGRLPWPDKDLPQAVLAMVDKWRRHAEDRLEQLAAAAATASGLPCRPRLTIRKAAKHSLTIPGEIDLLVADPQTRQIWVVEAKHLKEPFGPMEMAGHLAAFHGQAALAVDDSTHQFRQFQSSKFHPYSDELRGKLEAVHRDTGAALRALGISSTPATDADTGPADDDGGDWQVRGVFVTGHVEIAAFAAQPRFPFVSIERFRQFLTSPQPPAPGWWEPAEERPTPA